VQTAPGPGSHSSCIWIMSPVSIVTILNLTNQRLGRQGLALIGPLEGLGHGAVVVGEELSDLGDQVLDRGEGPAPEQFPRQDREKQLSKTNLMQERCRAVIGTWGVPWCCIPATRSSAASSPLSGGMGSGSGASGSSSCRMAAGSLSPSPGVRRSRRPRRPHPEGTRCPHRPGMTPHRKVPPLRGPRPLPPR